MQRQDVYNSVVRAIEIGCIPPLSERSCAVCGGADGLAYHHHDYTRVLEVMYFTAPPKEQRA